MNFVHILRRVVLDGYGYKYLIGSRMAARKLKALGRRCNYDAKKLVDIVFNFSYVPRLVKKWKFDIKPLQSKYEIVNLCKILQKTNPETIVEIGTACGGTLFLFGNIVDAEKIISIDLPGGSFGGNYPVWKIPLFKSMTRSKVVKLIRANSHEKKTVLQLIELLDGHKVDFLFIDGDHTYEGVKQDFEMYTPLVKKGGIVAFHDIATHKPEICCHVDIFWKEISQQYKSEEVIEVKDQNCGGIGILYL